MKCAICGSEGVEVIYINDEVQIKKFKLKPESPVCINCFNTKGFYEHRTAYETEVPSDIRSEIERLKKELEELKKVTKRGIRH